MFILDAIDDDIDAILKIQRNPKWQTLSVRAEFTKGTIDNVIVKSVSIESFEKKRVTITITIIIKEMYI